MGAGKKANKRARIGFEIADKHLKNLSSIDGSEQVLNQIEQNYAGSMALQSQGAAAANAAYDSQNDALGMMRSAAQGNAPSAAALQMQAGNDAAMRSNLALGAAGRGGSGAGLRTAMQRNAEMQAQNLQATGALRAQEMAQARGMYGQMAGDMRNQGIGLQTAGMSAAMQNTGARQSVVLANQTAAENQEARRMAVAGQAQAEMARYDNMIMGGIGAGLSALGAAAPLIKSDKRAKENVAPAEKSIGKMLGALAAKEYDYKAEHNIPGRHVGVMAQDLEKSELGSKFVKEGADGVKRVDYGAMAPTLLASQVMLYKKLQEKK
jgi:hypothetical protein